MKKFVFLIACLSTLFGATAQVSINSDGSQPDPSAMLDVKSATRGFLPPRMTRAEINAIVNPVNGLMVFCSDCESGGNGAMVMFLNGMWYAFNINCMVPIYPAAGVHTSSLSQITWNWNTVPDATGYKWNTSNDYSGATDMGTATTKTETGLNCNTAYSCYVWAYNACGNSGANTLTQSTTQSPAAGVTITASANPVCAGTSVTFTATPDNGGSTPAWQWKKNGTSVSGATNSTYAYPPAHGDLITCQLTSSNPCAPNNPAVSNGITMTVNAVPAAPVSGSHVPGETQITWNWNTVAGATGYKWNTANDYGTATGMGTATSNTETGLTCNTPYNRYVWAFNGCGVSNPVTLAQSTSTCSGVITCGQTLTIHHIEGEVAPVSKITSYGTVTGIPGEATKCWITKNLGATQQATAVNDATEASAGWYWQFNRKQGYMHDGSILTPAWTIQSISENSDWLTANDPCSHELGSQWRLPTYTEWYNVDNAGSWTNWNGSWNSGLKLHAAGYLNSWEGNLNMRGSIGYYWSSTMFNTVNGWMLGASSNNSAMNNLNKAYGYSVRCLRD